MTNRTFLLLQGVATPFFSELGKSLEQAGHHVLRISFCGGDYLSGYWLSFPLWYFKTKSPSSQDLHYRGDIKGLPSYYQTVFDAYQITDILLFGDTRPIHLPAINIAKQRNIRVYVYEEGYFRPHWISLDKGGVNAYSSLPKSREIYENYKHQSTSLTPKKVGGGLAIRAWFDFRYHFATLMFSCFYPYYQSHRPERAVKEYWGWIKRFPSLYFHYNKASKQKINILLKEGCPFYLLPLQLDADSQMRIHSPIKTVRNLIKTTIASFAKHATRDDILVIKNHPLDPWFIDYNEIIRSTAIQNNIVLSRIIYLESGDLSALLKHARGTVLVNSTVGTSALSAGCPVIALGSALYDIEGLTFQGSLDDFWANATPPDKKLFNNFKQYLIDNSQINGGFYNKKGINMAVQGSLVYFEKDAKY